MSVSLSRPAAGVLAALAALTRADVVVLDARGAVTASTTTDTVARVVARRAGAWPPDGRVREVRDGPQRYLVAAGPVGDLATMVFVRDLTRDLAGLPAFRGVVGLSGAAAVLLGLLLGTVAAHRLARPVSALADAADRLAAGDVGAPLMRSSIREVTRLSDAARCAARCAARSRRASPTSRAPTARSPTARRGSRRRSRNSSSASGSR